MADTLDITAGAGTTIATDDVGGVHYQRIKLSDGTADASGVIAADIGVKANALRVAPANDITDGTYIGDIKFGESLATVTTVDTVTNLAQLGGTAIAMNEGVLAAGVQRVTLATDDDAVAHLSNIATALQIIDDWDDANFCNVNLNLAGTDAGVGESALDGTELRVTIATDDDGVAHLGTIAGAVSATHMQCDIVAGTVTTVSTVSAITSLDKALYVDDGAWTGDTSSHFLVGGIYQSTPQTITDGKSAPLEINANGSLRVTDANITACNTGAVVISSGTVTTVSTVTSLTQMGGVAITMGEGALDGGCQRVTLATDDDGVAHLSTIAGAVSATHMQCDIVEGTVTTVSTVTNLSQMSGTAITMDEGVHDGGCQRVTIATDDDGVLSLGIMDDWDATHASAAPADGAQIMGAAYSTALPADVGADADAARLVTDRYGRLCVGLQPQAFKAIVDNADTTTAREIVAATASRKIYITSLIISVDTAGNYWLEDGDATQVTGKMYFAANGGCSQTFPEGTPLNTVTVNKALNVKGSTAGNVSVTVTGYLAV